MTAEDRKGGEWGTLRKSSRPQLGAWRETWLAPNQEDKSHLEGREEASRGGGRNRVATGIKGLPPPPRWAWSGATTCSRQGLDAVHL